MTRERNLAARLGGWSARHRKTAIFGWLLLVVVATLVGGVAGQVGLTQSEQGSGDSARAMKIIEDAGIKSPAGENVIIQSRDGSYKAAVRDVRDRVQATGLVDLGTTLYSSDHRDALVRFTVKGDRSTADKRIQPVLDAVAAAQQAHPDLKISEAGDASGNKWFNNMIGKNFHRAEWTAVPLALGILLVTFGALLAAILPVALALTAFMMSLGILAVASHAIHVDDSTNSIMLLMGLAVGVDYCLFYIRREREERALGRDKDTALRIAAATSGRSVLISGLTVMVAMAGMFLSGLQIFQSMALATIIMVFVAMVGSVTVLPAMLSLLGDRVELGRMPWRWFRGRVRKPARHRFWGALLRPVLARPGIAATVAGLFMVVLALPVVGIHTEKLSDVQQIPQRSSLAVTLKAIEHSFPGGPSPATVVLKADDLSSPATKQAISDFQATEPGIQTQLYPQANVARFDVPLAGTGTDAAARAALTKLRTQTVPSTLGKVGEAKVSGDLAFSQDFNHALSVSIGPVFVFVLGMAFLLMLLAFRSLGVAITAILLNLLSVGASYGVMVAIFQHGWGASLVDTFAPGALESWIPLFVFVVLFGLSMDYHVFVVSRIREAYDRGLSTKDAIAHGIKSSAGVVTSAAIIMVAVFAVFGTLSMQDFKQLGVGLAVAILLDATIIRAILLPAVMCLLGDGNWYLPRWLGWLPRFSHETPVQQPQQQVRIPA
jgi:RND superfamily putative drug exporter